MIPLITGGCGFIGSHLAEFHTTGGMPVMVLDDLSSGSEENLAAPEMVALTVGDVADAALVESLVAEVDVVFHLAAIASVETCTNEPERAHRTNVSGTQTIFDAVARVQQAEGRKIPIIYASSAAVYGDNPTLPLSESAAPFPVNRYGEQKLQNERIALQAFERHGVTSVGLRFFNVYGARQDPHSPYSGVISKFVEAAKTSYPLTFYGDGEQTRDFIHVGDIVHLLLASLAFCDSADVYNGCTGRSTSLKQLARIIGQTVGPVTTRHESAREGDIRHSLGAPDLAETVLGFRATTLLSDGLNALVNHA